MLEQMRIIVKYGCVAPEYVLEQLIRAEYVKYGAATKQFAHSHYRLTELGKVMMKQLEAEEKKQGEEMV